NAGRDLRLPPGSERREATAHRPGGAAGGRDREVRLVAAPSRGAQGTDPRTRAAVGWTEGRQRLAPTSPSTGRTFPSCPRAAPGPARGLPTTSTRTADCDRRHARRPSRDRTRRRRGEPTRPEGRG